MKSFYLQKDSESSLVVVWPRDKAVSRFTRLLSSSAIRDFCRVNSDCFAATASFWKKKSNVFIGWQMERKDRPCETTTSSLTWELRLSLPFTRILTEFTHTMGHLFKHTKKLNRKGSFFPYLFVPQLMDKRLHLIFCFFVLQNMLSDLKRW